MKQLNQKLNIRINSVLLLFRYAASGELITILILNVFE